MPRSFAALDTDFMLALEAGFTGCQSAIDFLGKVGFHCLVPPCVEESLFWLSVDAENPAMKSLAASTLSSFSSYGILKDDLRGMDKLLTRKSAEEWLASSLCPDATVNDYLLVTESSQLGAKVLLTASDPIIGHEQTIQHALIDKHLNQISLIDFRQFP
jgi:hypothetical protein